MDSVNIKIAPEEHRARCKKYLDFEKKRQISKSSYRPALLVCALLFFAGLLFNVGFIMLLGGIAFSIVLSIFLWYLHRFNSYEENFFKNWDQKIEESGNGYHLSFNETELVIDSEYFFQRIKWPLIKYFKEHKQTLYLFTTDKEMFIMVSKADMGEAAFANLRNILHQKSRLLR